MNEEKQKIKKELKKLLKDPTKKVECALRCDTEPLLKSHHNSTVIRDSGNKKYLEKNHDKTAHRKILETYNRSLAFAPINSDAQALAYANKSALLRHLHKFSESIIEIDKALKITESNSLKIKLLCRKADCLTALDSPENLKNLEKAKYALSKLKEPDQLAKSLETLIQNTEKTVKDGLLKMPKKDKKKAAQIKAIISLREEDTPDFVRVSYSKKLGIHLIATRDFKPGEILLVEKPFCAITNATNFNACFLYCGHCFKFLWTSVPCDHCTWCMFCSDECKNQAWKEYHDMECLVISQVNRWDLFCAYPYCQLALRVLIKSWRRAGSITELKADLHDVLKYKDRGETISSDFTLDGHKYFYSLLGNAFPDEDEKLIRKSALTLIGIAKYSRIFGTKFNSKNIHKIVKDDDAVFVGALFLKTCRILILNLHMTFLQNEECKSPKLFEALCKASICKSECCGNSAFMTLKASSMTISCCPNVERCCTFDNNSIAYALKPIKKGEQLFYGVKSIYTGYHPIAERQKSFRKRYGVDCDCQVCRENWTEKDFTDVIPKEFPPQMTKVMLEFIELTKNKGTKYQDNFQMLSKTKEILEEFWKYLRLPSGLLIHGVTYLIKTYVTIYGSPPEGEVPDECYS